MDIWRWRITRRRRNPVNGRYELPWEVLKAEHLSVEARAVIARCARSAAKDYIEELQEKERERADSDTQQR